VLFCCFFSRSVAIMALLCLHCEGCVVCQSSADGSVAPNSGGPVECHSQLVQERSLHPRSYLADTRVISG
jgi:hypothetical protein